MADKEASALTAGAALDGTEVVVVKQGSNSRKVTTEQIANAGFRGALVKKAADLTGQNMTSITAITWDTEVYDIGDWHESVTNPSYLTVPAGVSKVRLQGQVKLGSITADMWTRLVIHKNGAIFDGHAEVTVESGVTSPAINIVSPVYDVSEGDDFQLKLTLETDTSVDIEADSSWFAIEKVA
jgi:hypothetical protein